MRRTGRSQEGDDAIWAPLADTMTLVACVFLLVFLATLAAFKRAPVEPGCNAQLQECTEALSHASEPCGIRLDTMGRENAGLREQLAQSATSNQKCREQLSHPPGTADGVRVDQGVLTLGMEQFDVGSAELNAKGRLHVQDSIVPWVRQALATPGRKVIVSGHTDSQPFRVTKHGNWRLSFDRAQNVLIQILDAAPELDTSRLVATGHADSSPIHGLSPDDPRNRRVEIRQQDEPKTGFRLFGD